MPSFSAKILMYARNPYVVPPAAALKSVFQQAKKDKGPIPARGTVNGAKFQQTLVNYLGGWKLHLNGPMRKGAKAEVGDTVKVTMIFDAKPRTFPMHPAFTRALKNNKKAHAAFLRLAPSYQKELTRYVGFSKTKETLDRNIFIIVDYFAGHKPKGLYALLRIKRK